MLEEGLRVSPLALLHRYPCRQLVVFHFTFSLLVAYISFVFVFLTTTEMA